MKKFLLTHVIFFSSFSIINAQGGYVKFLTAKDFQKKTIQILNGEILPFEKSTDTAKINIIYGNKKITDLGKNSTQLFVEVNPKILSKDSVNILVQSKTSSNKVFVDAKILPNEDTITVFSKDNKQLTQLIKVRDANIDRDKCGDTFRLVISNSPTIFYALNKLQEFDATPKDKDQDEINDDADACPDIKGVKSSDPAKNGCPEEKGFFASLPWWQILIFILGLLGIAFGVWWYLRSRKKQINYDSEYAQYNGGSLNDFANQYGIPFSELSALNEIIPRDYNQMKKKKRSAEKRIEGEMLRIKREAQKNNTINNELIPQKQEDSLWDNPNPTQLPFKLSNQDDISQQLSKILSEIQKIPRGNDNGNEQRLNNKITTLETEKKLLAEENKKHVDTSKQLGEDKQALTKELSSTKEQLENFRTEVSGYNDKVILVEYLKVYCEGVFPYLSLCNEISNQAYDYFNRITQQSTQQAFAIGHLLMKYQDSVKTIPIGKWQQIIHDIKDTGATTNKQLIRSFSQIQNDSEKQWEFTRILFTEFLVKYSSNILILAESLKNLSRFQASSDLVNEIENNFSKHVSELRNKIKTTDLEFKYVPLFQNYLSYSSFSKAVNEKLSIAYQSLDGLEKDSVVEVKSYGFKNPFGDTDTLIILA